MQAAFTYRPHSEMLLPHSESPEEYEILRANTCPFCLSPVEEANEPKDSVEFAAPIFLAWRAVSISSMVRSV